MIIKDITEQKVKKTGVVLPFEKNNIFQIKINKTIEIVVVPNPGEKNAHQDNVGIILEENKILKILSKRYADVSITEINTKNIILDDKVQCSFDSELKNLNLNETITVKNRCIGFDELFEVVKMDQSSIIK